MFLGQSTIWQILASTLVGLAFVAYMLVRACRYQLHMLQLNTYRNTEYWVWLTRQPHPVRALWVPLLLLVAGLLWPGESPIRTGIFYGVALAVLVVRMAFFPPARKPAKKPFVLTKRMRRLYGATPGLVILYAFLVWGLCPASRPEHVGWLLLAATCFPWIFVYLANGLMKPVENRINAGFFRMAQAKLRSMPHLTTVGITGSYGKTSVKVIVGAILSEQFETLVTPHSYNTPMGVSLTINNQLQATTEVFVCEMGARHRQDIAEMCDLARPDIAVLTAIGEQHLETFGSQENIIAAKFDIIRALPPGGTAVVNGDNPLIRENLAPFSCPIRQYGLDPSNDYWADQIRFDKHGTHFVVHGEGQVQPMTTSLLGRHNVCNIVGGIAVARLLGLDWKKISRGVAHIPPIEHRLQLLNAGSYTVVDDAFNANPAGTEAALEVLSTFQGGKKIIVTPGMVELGFRQDELNRAFGTKLPAVCDFIILVGKKHTRPIYEGAKAAGAREGQLLVASDLEEARTILAGLVHPGDVVLFENDLPDTYNE